MTKLVIAGIEVDTGQPERWLVCGGRKFGVVSDRYSAADMDRAHREVTLLNQTLDGLVIARGFPSVVITGGAPGADTLADEWRKGRGLPGQVLKADWDGKGRRAGIVRNTQMLAVLRSIRDARKLVIAFPGTEGTLNMIQQATAAGVEVYRAGW